MNSLGLHWVYRDVCAPLWAYSRSDFFEPDSTVPIARSQWRETRALAGSIAESLMLGVANYVEIMWHEQAIQSGVEPAGMALAQRHLADLLCETTIAVGHRLVNLVARTMRTDPTTRKQMDGAKPLKALGTAYEPFVTTTRKAWLSLNAAELTALRSVASSQPNLLAALDRLDALEASPQWRGASDHRAENFHRWRREHEYVAGVDQNSGTATDVHDYLGQVIGKDYGIVDRRYTAADNLGAQTVLNAGAGLEETARAASNILDEIIAALPDLTNGLHVQITHTQSGLKTTFQRKHT